MYKINKVKFFLTHDFNVILKSYYLLQFNSVLPTIDIIMKKSKNINDFFSTSLTHILTLNAMLYFKSYNTKKCNRHIQTG